jgi:hypothetical protein
MLLKMETVVLPGLVVARLIYELATILFILV